MAAKKNQDDDEMVFYCKDCCSLKILDIGCNLLYCGECNSTNIEKTTIDKWEILAERNKQSQKIAKHK